jgi:hypothetical protein
MRLPRGGGRGRPRGKTAERHAREKAVMAMIYKLLDRPRSRGALTDLQGQVHRKYGIAPRDFYRLVQRTKAWHHLSQRVNAHLLPMAERMDAAMRRLVADADVIDRYITPTEFDRWQHRDGAAVARLARMRAKRAPPKAKSWRDLGRPSMTWADLIGRGK